MHNPKYTQHSFQRYAARRVHRTKVLRLWQTLHLHGHIIVVAADGINARPWKGLRHQGEVARPNLGGYTCCVSHSREYP